MQGQHASAQTSGLRIYAKLTDLFYGEFCGQQQACHVDRLFSWPRSSSHDPGQQPRMNTFFLPWLSPINASLAFALCFVFISWLAMYWLYRKNIFIKV
jgi:uncharacterized protein YqiB (DUF1249 family)